MMMKREKEMNKKETKTKNRKKEMMTETMMKIMVGMMMKEMMVEMMREMMMVEMIRETTTVMAKTTCHLTPNRTTNTIFISDKFQVKQITLPLCTLCTFDL